MPVAWRVAIAPVSIFLGYAGALLLLGGLTPNHRALVTKILTRHLLQAATSLVARV